MDDTKRTAVATDLYASGEYLDRVADWHGSESSGKVQYMLPLLRKHNLVPRSVVDIGCGVGEVLRLMQPALPEGAELVGYDIAPEALKLAASRANDHLQFREGALPDPAEHYDLLLALDVIEHLEDYKAFNALVKRNAARRGGLCVLCVLKGGAKPTRTSASRRLHKRANWSRSCGAAARSPTRRWSSASPPTTVAASPARARSSTPNCPISKRPSQNRRPCIARSWPGLGQVVHDGLTRLDKT